MQIDKEGIEREAYLLQNRQKSSEVLGAQRAKMQQTHAVRHRQYTFEEKSRRSFCPDRKQRICGIERESHKNTKNTCKQRTENINKRKKINRNTKIMCENYKYYTNLTQNGKRRDILQRDIHVMNRHRGRCMVG